MGVKRDESGGETYLLSRKRLERLILTPLLALFVSLFPLLDILACLGPSLNLSPQDHVPRRRRQSTSSLGLPPPQPGRSIIGWVVVATTHFSSYPLLFTPSLHRQPPDRTFSVVEEGRGPEHRRRQSWPASHNLQRAPHLPCAISAHDPQTWTLLHRVSPPALPQMITLA